MSSSLKIAVVTGANRGLGFEASRQLAKQGIQVILTSRDEAKGKLAADTLQAEGLNVTSYPLDVTCPESIEHLTQFIKSEFGHLEILVNNAGILLDREDSSILETPIETIQQTLETNVYAPLRLSQALVPLMRVQDYGRIVNVSSGLGQLNEMGGGYTAYRVSKTALNAITRILAAELEGTNILVNSVCPGWVKTDMGGPNAPRTPLEGVDTIVWLATLPYGATTGNFYRDRQPIPW